jgi:hypothetical protein
MRSSRALESPVEIREHNSQLTASGCLVKGFHGFTSANPRAEEATGLPPGTVSLKGSAAPRALAIRMSWAAGWHGVYCLSITFYKPGTTTLSSREVKLGYTPTPYFPREPPLLPKNKEPS